MYKSIRLILFIVLISVIFYSTSFAGSWTFRNVDTLGNVGKNTSIFALSTTTIYATYYDASNFDLKFARTTDGGISWDTTTLYSLDISGQASSIWAVGTYIYVAFYSTKSGSYKRLYIGRSVDSGNNWTFTQVDSGDEYLSLSIDGVDSDNIIISYYPTGKKLRYARSINASTALTFTQNDVETVNNKGNYNSIKQVTATNAYITYFDAVANDLKFAKTINGGTNWTLSIIDSTGIVGQSTSLASIDSNNHYVSYFDITNSKLKVAYTSNSGTSWTITDIDSPNTGSYNSISTTTVSTVYIVYYDSLLTNLKLATSSNANLAVPTYTISVLDTSALTGTYCSIATPNDDNRFISYYDATLENFKIAKYSATVTPPTVVANNVTVQATNAMATYKSSTQFQGVNDASRGDNLESGLPATAVYGFNGSTFDRVRSSITYGLQVDVTRGSLTVTIPSDVSIVGTYTDNSVNSTKKVATIPARANAASPTWTEGYQVPLSVDLNGALRVTPFSVPAGGLPINTAISSSFTHNQVLVNNLGAVILAANSNRKSAIIRNIGSITAYIGGVSVTTVNGYPIFPNESHIFDRSTGAIYGITSAGSTTFSYIEE